MNTDKLIPIDFSRKITPPVMGDTVYNSKSNDTYILSGADVIAGFDSSNLFVVSFADRPNTGKRPGFPSLVLQEDGRWTSGDLDLDWAIDIPGINPITEWKPNKDAMLKQWQAGQLEQGVHIDADGDLPVGSEKVGVATEELTRDEALKKLIYACDGFSQEYRDQNYGGAKYWMRHIDSAYRDYENAEDERHDIAGTPALTQELPVEKAHYRSWDGKENLDIGMAYTSGGGIDCMFVGIHAGIVIGRPIDMTRHNKLYLSTIDKSFCKPIQTDEEKLKSALMDSIEWNATWEYNVDKLLASDKFTITLKG